MTPQDVARIAQIVNLIRPAWSPGLIAAVLNDPRMIRRPPQDALIALMVCALDPTTTAPGRVHEHTGNWWVAVQVATGTPARQVAYPSDQDCDICNRPQVLCARDTSHDYEPRHVAARRRALGSKPTPEQREAMAQAALEAQRVRDEQERARLEAPPREIPPVSETLARHTQEVPDHDNGT